MFIESLSSALVIINQIKELVGNNNELKSKISDLTNEFANIALEKLELTERIKLLIEENEQLKKQVMQIEQFEKEKVNYTLTRFEPDTFLYVRNSISEDLNPKHCICTKCYEESKKSILQTSSMKLHYRILVCHHCSSEYLVRNDIDFSCDEV